MEEDLITSCIKQVLIKELHCTLVEFYVIRTNKNGGKGM